MDCCLPLFAGQPFVIIATTAPIALCNKIVYDLSISLDVPFYSLYACVGLFNAFFLMLYGILGLNSLIKFSTRSVEEIFSAIHRLLLCSRMLGLT